MVFRPIQAVLKKIPVALTYGLFLQAQGDIAASLSIPKPSLQPHGQERRILPLYESSQSVSTTAWQLPPIASKVTDKNVESLEFDFLYPLLTFDQYGEEYRFQFLQGLGFSGGQNQDKEVSRRFNLVPFLFHQTSEVPEKDYFAFAPFFGTIKGRYLRDEIEFRLAPLYLRTRKRDIVTQNYLYPFFHKRTGEKLSGWQALPLFSYEKRGVRRQANGYGEPVIKPGHEKLTLAWPFYHDVTTGIGSTNPISKQALLPLFVKERSPQRDYTSLLWPFFNFIDDRKKGYHETSLLWPFFTKAYGEGKQAFRLFPLVSRAKSPSAQSDAYFWPLYKYQRKKGTVLDRQRWRSFYFLYSRAHERSLETRRSRTRTDLWPLFSHSREFDGETSIQFPAPLEPILPASKSVTRNWSPLWTIYRHMESPTRARTSTRWLWNLFREEQENDQQSRWFFFGLLSETKIDGISTWKFLNIPLKRTETNDKF